MRKLGLSASFKDKGMTMNDTDTKRGGVERSPKRITRQLRDRKERKFYTDDWVGDADDEIEGPQSFDLEEKLNSPRFDRKLVKEMTGQEFNLAYIQQHGFTEPLIFKDKQGLGIRIPGPNFTVSDVKTCVGSKRLLDVMDVKTQKNLEMSMKEWQEYYDKTDRERLLNVISLEFSHTKLENFIEAPTVVRQLDWVDRVWPRHLKNMQTESTNVMDEMMYPKVQKYCLMSVKGCYTDFHVDFGGTSVWYHILKGAKVFWLIPPTDKNLESYQEWVLSGKQGDTFFADNVEICSRVYLQSGDTFFIPSGWIHAVYTPKDSLVFGGNFLHSFGIEKQLKIATVEEQTKVPQKFRYPFFTEMLWYTLERYVHCLLGQSFIRIPSEDEDGNERHWKPMTVDKLTPNDVALSPQELLGLKAIVLYLHQLPIQRKNVPALIYDPVSLLKSIRQIVEMHRYDDPTKAVTGKPILVWPGEKPEDVGKVTPVRRYRMGGTAKTNSGTSWPENSINLKEEHASRRIRCGRCQACTTTEDCNQCPNCAARPRAKDHTLLGSDHFRKMCVMKECMAPLLSPSLICAECGKDGWLDTPSNFSRPLQHAVPSTLMECSLCWTLVHPICIGFKVNPRTIGIVNDDLPNSWECPLCLEKTKPIRILKTSKSVDESAGGKGPSNNVISNSNYNSDSNNIKPTYYQNHDGKGLNGLITNNTIQWAHKTEPPSNNMQFDGNFSTSPVKEGRLEIKKLIMDKLARDNEDSVKQKLDEVVRRKSTEEANKGIAGKINPTFALKRSISSESEGPVPKYCRRLSDQMEITSENVSPIPNSNKAKKPKKTFKDPKATEEKEEEVEETLNGSAKTSPIKYPFRTDLSGKIMGGSSKSLKGPTNVVRPSSTVTSGETEAKKSPKKKISHQGMLKDGNVWLKVFKWLDIRSLCRVQLVSKDWNRIGVTPELWQTIDLSHRPITAELLKGVVRRQPKTVILNWTKLSKQQLLWFISRLPQLRHLALQGSSWNTISALKTCFCPTLEGLDLGYVDNLLDGAVREILAPPSDSRPGLTDSKSRLRQLSYLCFAGASLSDVSLRYVTQHAGNISKLDLSCCPRITDAGIAQLGAPDSPSLTNLTHLYITGCPQLTNISLDHLKRCKNLIYLDIQKIPQISSAGLAKFLTPLNETEQGRSSKVVVKHSLQVELQTLYHHQQPQSSSNVVNKTSNAPNTTNSHSTANAINPNNGPSSASLAHNLAPNHPAFLLASLSNAKPAHGHSSAAPNPSTLGNSLVVSIMP